MRVRRRVRRLLLTGHVVGSVGWLGTGYATWVLALVGLVSGGTRARGAYEIMLLFDLAALLPLGLVSLITGLLLGLGTHWGITGHYWVLAKLVINLAVLVVPLIARRPLIGQTIDTGSSGDAGLSVFVASTMAVLALTLATVLSIYKPWGRTPRGRRRARTFPRSRTTASSARP